MKPVLRKLTRYAVQPMLARYVGPTACVTCVWVNVDFILEQKKPEVKKLVDKAQTRTSWLQELLGGFHQPPVWVLAKPPYDYDLYLSGMARSGFSSLHIILVNHHRFPSLSI